MSYLKVEKQAGGYAIVHIAREPANVMDLEFWQQLTSAVEGLEQDADVRGVIFASGLQRDIFTAGNDINELYAPRTSPERYKQFWVTSNALMARLYSSPLATVAAIRGACPAGGCGLALCCDVRLMSREVGHIGLNEVALGIPVPLFWGRLMTRVIGQGKTDRLLQMAHMPQPAEALRVGLVDDLAPKDDLIAAAQKAMKQLLASPDAGRIATKQFQRQDFSHAWLAHANVEAGTQFSLLERPETMRTLEGVLKRLSGRKASKL